MDPLIGKWRMIPRWEMVTLQLCRLKFQVLSTQRNRVADFIRLKLNFIFKHKIAFEPPFGGLGGNERTPSIARWKTLGRLPIRHN